MDVTSGTGFVPSPSKWSQQGWQPKPCLPDLPSPVLHCSVHSLPPKERAVPRRWLDEAQMLEGTTVHRSKTWDSSSVPVHLCWCSINITGRTPGKWRQTMGCKWLQFSGTRNCSSFSDQTHCKETYRMREKAEKWNFHKGNQNELLEFPAKIE